MSRTEVLEYIELEWPEVTDAQHCAALVTSPLIESYADLDKAICNYQRNLHL